MKKLAGLVLLFSALYASGQTTTLTESEQTIAADSTTSFYFSARSKGLALYNGRQFSGGYISINGTAFYQFTDWLPGTIRYEGITYQHIPLLYDIYRDEIIAKHPNGTAYVLLNDRVQEFSYGGLNFVNLHSTTKGAPSSGYYQILVKGKLTIFVKRVKLLEEKIVDLKVERSFIDVNKYYAYINGEFHSFSKQKQLLSLLEGRNAILQDLRSAGLRFKTSPEAVITHIAEFYNQSNK